MRDTRQTTSARPRSKTGSASAARSKAREVEDCRRSQERRNFGSCSLWDPRSRFGATSQMLLPPVVLTSLGSASNRVLSGGWGGNMRTRKSSTLARRYISRLRTLSRSIWPSVWPLLQRSVTAFLPASISCRNVTKRCIVPDCWASWSQASSLSALLANRHSLLGGVLGDLDQSACRHQSIVSEVGTPIAASPRYRERAPSRDRARDRRPPCNARSWPRGLWCESLERSIVAGKLVE